MARKNTASLEAKALAAPSKSEGMRMLYAEGWTVAQVRGLFDVPYGFAYGVAQRGGFAETAATRRAPAKAKSTTKAPAKAPTRKAKVADTVSATAKVAAKIAKGKTAPVAKKPGRPTAARRAANRKAITAK